MRIKQLIVPVTAAILVAVIALALAGHKDTSPHTQSTATGKSATVTIKNYAFAPQSLTVKVGTRVTWTNRDSTAHTATADGGSFDTGTINPGQTRPIDLKRPGSYPYHCAFHAFMTGTITVIR